MNGKLKIVQNRKGTHTETEEDDDDEDDEIPEEFGTKKKYDTSERDGRYALIRTNPEEDALQIHTDGEIPGENFETNIRRSNRNSKNRIDTVLYLILETSGARKSLGKSVLYILQETRGLE